MALPKKIVHHGNIRYRVLQMVDGKPKAKFFEDLQTARSYSLATGADSLPQFLALPDGTRGRLLALLAKVGGIDSLDAAVSQYLASRPDTTKLISEAWEECVSAKRMAKKSQVYLDSLATGLRHLDRKFPQRTVDSLTTTEIQQWLDTSGWSPESKRTYLARVTTFYSWAKSRGYCAADPTAGVQAPEWVARRPQILTVEEVMRLLSACLEVDPGMIHYFAVALFAGVRPSECQRLTPAHIQEDHIEIEAVNAKTRTRRIVEIQGNLKEWLALPGELPVASWRTRFEAVAKAAGLTPWVPDIMRHSFCSYALPVKGPGWVALHAGNSETVIYQHYREIVREKDAKEYWAITPDSVRAWASAKIVPLSACA